MKTFWNYLLTPANKKTIVALSEAEKQIQKNKNMNANIGSYFTIKGQRCVVVAVDAFAGVPHYYFQSLGKYYPKHKGGLELVDSGNHIVGWIPVEFVGQTEFTK